MIVAFQALKVNQQALLYLIEEWTQLGISQVCCVFHQKQVSALYPLTGTTVELPVSFAASTTLRLKSQHSVDCADSCIAMPRLPLQAMLAGKILLTAASWAALVKTCSVLERVLLCNNRSSDTCTIAYTLHSYNFAICRSWHAQTSCWATLSLPMTLPAHVQAPIQASQLNVTLSVIPAPSVLLLSIEGPLIKMLVSQHSSFSQPKKGLGTPSLDTSFPWKLQPPCRQSTQQPDAPPPLLPSPPACTMHASCIASFHCSGQQSDPGLILDLLSIFFLCLALCTAFWHWLLASHQMRALPFGKGC